MFGKGAQDVHDSRNCDSANVLRKQDYPRYGGANDEQRSHGLGEFFHEFFSQEDEVKDDPNQEGPLPPSNCAAPPNWMPLYQSYPQRPHPPPGPVVPCHAPLQSQAFPPPCIPRPQPPPSIESGAMPRHGGLTLRNQVENVTPCVPLGQRVHGSAVVNAPLVPTGALEVKEQEKEPMRSLRTHVENGVGGVASGHALHGSAAVDAKGALPKVKKQEEEFMRELPWLHPGDKEEAGPDIRLRGAGQNAPEQLVQHCVLSSGSEDSRGMASTGDVLLPLVSGAGPSPGMVCLDDAQKSPSGPHEAPQGRTMRDEGVQVDAKKLNSSEIPSGKPGRDIGVQCGEEQGSGAARNGGFSHMNGTCENQESFVDEDENQRSEHREGNVKNEAGAEMVAKTAATVVKGQEEKNSGKEPASGALSESMCSGANFVKTYGWRMAVELKFFEACDGEEDFLRFLPPQKYKELWERMHSLEASSDRSIPECSADQTEAVEGVAIDVGKVGPAPRMIVTKKREKTNERKSKVQDKDNRHVDDAMDMDFAEEPVADYFINQDNNLSTNVKEEEAVLKIKSGKHVTPFVDRGGSKVRKGKGRKMDKALKGPSSPVDQNMELGKDQTAGDDTQGELPKKKKKKSRNMKSRRDEDEVAFEVRKEKSRKRKTLDSGVDDEGAVKAARQEKTDRKLKKKKKKKQATCEGAATALADEPKKMKRKKSKKKLKKEHCARTDNSDCSLVGDATPAELPVDCEDDEKQGLSSPRESAHNIEEMRVASVKSAVSWDLRQDYHREMLKWVRKGSKATKGTFKNYYGGNKEKCTKFFQRLKKKFPACFDEEGVMEILRTKFTSERSRLKKEKAPTLQEKQPKKTTACLFHDDSTRGKHTTTTLEASTRARAGTTAESSTRSLDNMLEECLLEEFEKRVKNPRRSAKRWWGHKC